jgi:hypothetical protein
MQFYPDFENALLLVGEGLGVRAFLTLKTPYSKD